MINGSISGKRLHTIGWGGFSRHFFSCSKNYHSEALVVPYSNPKLSLPSTRRQQCILERRFVQRGLYGPTLRLPRKREQQICKLNKSIYGLRQASRQWFHKFSSALLAKGFTQSKNDYSLFYIGLGHSMVFLLVYVDDIIISGPDMEQIAQVQKKLEYLFKLKILSDLKYFLGLEIDCSSEGISLSQRTYALSLLEDTGFLDAKPASVLMDPSLKLTATDGDPVAYPSLYKCMIGRLMYLTISRSDITFAVSKLNQYMSNPRIPHEQALHHLLRYLKSCPDKVLLFHASSSLSLKAFADADWGSCLDTKRSTSGFMVFLGDSLLSWKTKKQQTVSKSFMKAEYRALSVVSGELTWLNSILKEFGVDVDLAMVYCDNQSTIYLSTNPTFHE